MSDPFEEHFQQWLHGVAWEAKVRQEEQNLNTLVKTLKERGYEVKLEPPYYIQVNPDTLLQLTITASVARETDPTKLLEWVEQRLQLFARELALRRAIEAERKEELDVCGGCYGRYLPLRKLQAIYPDWPPSLAPQCDYCEKQAKYHVHRSDWITFSREQV